MKKLVLANWEKWCILRIGILETGGSRFDSLCNGCISVGYANNIILILYSRCAPEKKTIMEAFMSYMKAEEVLPKELIQLIQEYTDGAYIYIPRKPGINPGSKVYEFCRILRMLFSDRKYFWLRVTMLKPAARSAQILSFLALSSVL